MAPSSTGLALLFICLRPPAGAKPDVRLHPLQAGGNDLSATGNCRLPDQSSAGGTGITGAGSVGVPPTVALNPTLITLLDG